MKPHSDQVHFALVTCNEVAVIQRNGTSWIAFAHQHIASAEMSECRPGVVRLSVVLSDGREFEFPSGLAEGFLEWFAARVMVRRASTIEVLVDE